ncbi:hypothetical protein Nmel_018187, partial [Mimus melanotis]
EGLSSLAPQPLSRGVLVTLAHLAPLQRGLPSLEYPEPLSGEVCPAWHPWLFSSGILPSLTP